MTDEQHQIMRSIVMEEVNNQLAPIKDAVEKVRRKLNGLWSNGDGGPPGYLETAREQDKQRYAELSADQKTANTKLEIIEKIILLEKDRRAHRDKRLKQLAQVWWKMGLPLLLAILSALSVSAGWAYRELRPFVQYMYRDYLKHHPDLSEELRKMSRTNDPVLSWNSSPPQDARGWDTPHAK